MQKNRLNMSIYPIS